MVAASWSQVLGIEQVGIHDNFFALGGYSLLATQVIGLLYASTQVELPLRSFFETPTVAQFAQTITQLEAKGARSRIPALRHRSREAHRMSLTQGTNRSLYNE